MTTIVSLHAHPDDEALLTGGWLAQRAAAGDRVVVVFATDGGSGLASTRYPVGSLGEIRRGEAVDSARALGVSRVEWLGYADSGMASAPTHGRGRFVDEPVRRSAEAVAALLDAEGADVLTGYDARGGYGHPDHVRVHRVARVAQGLATRRPVLLEATLDRTWLTRLVRLVRPVAWLLPGLTVPAGDVYTAREEVTFAADVRDHVEAKRRALAAHRSQTTGGLRTVRVLLALPRPVARRLIGTEWFLEVR